VRGPNALGRRSWSPPREAVAPSVLLELLQIQGTSARADVVVVAVAGETLGKGEPEGEKKNARYRLPPERRLAVRRENCCRLRCRWDEKPPRRATGWPDAPIHPADAHVALVTARARAELARDISGHNLQLSCD
jgi:hypothetical protein